MAQPCRRVQSLLLLPGLLISLKACQASADVGPLLNFLNLVAVYEDKLNRVRQLILHT